MQCNKYQRMTIGNSKKGIPAKKFSVSDENCKFTIVYTHIHTGKHSFIYVLWIVTVTCAKLYSSATGAWALAKLTPWTPVSILLYDVRGQPNAVTFKAMLQQTDNTRHNCYMVFVFYRNVILALCMNTFPFPHIVPSMGGPFLVLQKKGLSGWLHHSCLHGSNVRYWGAQRESFLKWKAIKYSTHTW